jgi:hypothetical protein
MFSLVCRVRRRPAAARHRALRLREGVHAARPRRRPQGRSPTWRSLPAPAQHPSAQSPRSKPESRPRGPAQVEPKAPRGRDRCSPREPRPSPLIRPRASRAGRRGEESARRHLRRSGGVVAQPPMQDVTRVVGQHDDAPAGDAPHLGCAARWMLHRASAGRSSPRRLDRDDIAVNALVGACPGADVDDALGIA